jgi:glycolate oxidase subunit GlcD
LNRSFTSSLLRYVTCYIYHTGVTPRKVLAKELSALVGHEGVPTAIDGMYLRDATEGEGVSGRADAVCLPGTAEEVARVIAWCYQHEVPVVPRGGGTGLAGGAVPIDGGVVLGLERLNRIRAFSPLQWRAHVDAGVRTAALRTLARGNGLLFPPDPGAAEESQIGGNIATNAGGPHAFKYGATGQWVTGIEAVVAPGELITVGGPIRKDVAGYDLKSLLIGSEGTLGIITAAWLRLVPAPEATLPVVAFYEDTSTGCRAIEATLANGLAAAALEYVDEGALAATRKAFPAGVPDKSRFVVVAEADGSVEEAARLRNELVEVLGEDALAIHAPTDRASSTAVWRWRDGVSFGVRTQRGWKVSDDIVVPVDKLAEAVASTIEIGRRHDLPACSWGHAGDGNLHSTFMLPAGDLEGRARAHAAVKELCAMAMTLGGSVSGEHGLGLLKQGELARQWSPTAVDLHHRIKEVFDPKGLLNPGKKL